MVLDVLALRVAARYKIAAEAALWNAAVKEVSAFNKNYAKLQKLSAPVKDNDVKLLMTFSSGPQGGLPGSHSSSLTRWAQVCAPIELKDQTEDLLASRATLRDKFVLDVADNKEPLDELVKRVEAHTSIVQYLMSSVTTASFTYQGFKVSNPERMSDGFCRQTLEGVDYLKALFKKRGVDKALYDGIAEISLVPDNSYLSNKKASGQYFATARKIYLSGSIGGDRKGRFIKWVNEVFLHEFGHFVHMTFISGEARADWDAGWLAQTGEGEILNVTQGDRQRLFGLLKGKDFDLAATYKKLDPSDKERFRVWLGDSPLGYAIAVPSGKSGFKPTRRGQDILEKIEFPDRLPDYGPSGMKPSDVEFEKKKITEAIDRLGLDNPIVLEVPKGKSEMSDLGIVSDYGATDEQEDFAETFVAFMSAPEKLTPTSKFRMQRALSLSGLYGKPVMKLADDLIVDAVAYRYLQKIIGF